MAVFMRDRLMTRTLLCCFLAVPLFPSIVALGQSPQAVPDATLQLNTDLVVVDVVVTDAHQNPVHNLTAADFTLREDDHVQTIKTFTEHTAKEVATFIAPTSPKLDPGVFTDDPPVPANGPLNIVLLDRLNTPMQDQAYAMDQLSAYVKTAPAGTRIAIATLTSGQLSLLQGFTSDTELLRAALTSKHAEMNASLYLDNPVSGGGKVASDAGAKARFRREFTLNALDELGRYLSFFPGRKNLIWFSASFPVSMIPTGRDVWSTTPYLEDEFKKTLNLLALNQVAVYPIDAAGLTGTTWFDAANPGASTVLASNQGLSNSFQNASLRAANQKWAMTDIADPTGGQAFVNTNDLKGAVAQAVDAGSNYYALTYSPTSHNWNGQYRKIQVELNRPGLALVYRRGYYAIDPDAPAPKAEQKTGSNEPAPYNAMRAAMAYGAPEPAEIRFEAYVRPSIAGTEPALAPGNQNNARVKGPYRRYSVHYVAHERDIQCPVSPGGVNICTVEFAVCVYDVHGNLILSRGNKINAKIKSTYYTAFQQPGLHPGFQYRQEISVPAKGEYYLRVGVHDLTTNRVGAIELPVSVVSVLPPLSESNADAVAGALRR